MKIFLDTNIYLNFYHYTSEDLEELKKLGVAVKKKDVQLILTDQIHHEFKRNRESKIADALKRFKDQRFGEQLPQICKGYSNYEYLLRLSEEYERQKKIIIEQIIQDVKSNSLNADQVINVLLGYAEVFNTDDEILQKARKRMEIGNPPGKNNSLGDSINWEILLSNLKDEDDLVIVSDDKDFSSAMDENSLSGYLLEEWKSVKSSKITFYKKLSHFFKERFPTIKLASELSKELSISRFVNSGSFDMTHLAIRELRQFSDFTDQQVIQIADAALQNQQISFIKDDSDVKDFLEKLLGDKEKIIGEKRMEKLERVYDYIVSSKTAKLIDEIPF